MLMIYLHAKNPMRLIFPDEVNCNKDKFNCTIGNLQCIPWLWVCDGDEDCTDGSDEADGLCGLLIFNLYKCRFGLFVCLFVRMFRFVL